MNGGVFTFNKVVIDAVYGLICVLYPVTGGPRDFARFYVLETVARVPYFAYLSVRSGAGRAGAGWSGANRLGGAGRRRVGGAATAAGGRAGQRRAGGRSGAERRGLRGRAAMLRREPFARRPQPRLRQRRCRHAHRVLPSSTAPTRAGT